MISCDQQESSPSEIMPTAMVTTAANKVVPEVFMDVSRVSSDGTGGVHWSTITAYPPWRASATGGKVLDLFGRLLFREHARAHGDKGDRVDLGGHLEGLLPLASQTSASENLARAPSGRPFGLPPTGITTVVCNHTFRGTGITAYLENGGTLEKARQMAAHAAPPNSTTGGWIASGWMKS